MALNITRGKKSRPQKIAFYGPEGVGKTTLASQLPSPLFLDCEGGTDHLDVARVEIRTIQDFREACVFLMREPHDFKSVVIDTADWLAERDVEEMLKEDDKKSVEDYGFGKGYKKAEERFHDLLTLLDRVRKAGLHVVLLAHSKVIKFEEPDKSGSYDRYELKLEKKIAPLLKEWCDALLFINFETRIVEREKGNQEGKKRAIGGKKRLLHCERGAAYDAKNRHGMPEICEATVEALAPILDFKGDEAPAEVASEKAKPEPAEAKPEPAKDRDPVRTLDDAFNEVVEKAGGKEAVEEFLASRDLTLATINDEYKARVLKSAGAFAKQVAEHSRKLAPSK